MDSIRIRNGRMAIHRSGDEIRHLEELASSLLAIAEKFKVA